MSLSHMVDSQSTAVIDPDDAHLQYGPISTALRESALDEGSPWSDEICIAFRYVDTRWPGWNVGIKGVDYRTTKLFMAEYLADDGL